MLLNCKPEDKSGISEAPKPISELEMVWEQPFATQSGGEGREPQVADDRVLFTGKSGLTNNSSTICFDANSGDTLWVKENYIGRIPYTSHQFTEQGYYVVNKYGKTWVFNIETGEVVWTSNSDYGDWNFTVTNGNIYHSWKSPESAPLYHSIMKTRVAIENWESEFTLYQDSLDGYHPEIVGPIVWENQVGEDVLVFMNRGHKSALTRMDLFGYNTATRNLDIQVREIEVDGFPSPIQPIIDGNKIYIKGRVKVYCLDLVSGAILWENGFDDHDAFMDGSNLVIGEGKLLVHQGEALYAFDKNTGSRVWRNQKIGRLPSDLKVFEDMVYYTTNKKGRLHGVKISNGQLLLNIASPHEDTFEHYTNSRIEHGVGIHENLRYVYVQDGYFLMCFKLPKFN
ncbi:PQQ-binding-like beta-propeller repeat protein [Owenweeksia hongkongensis]|uniref:outer membrane protein assembly factor BamB family protein n=1 Tax=Owenweeksia hongkongensis TaxID=253245 RepID=UPI003A9132A8